MGHLSSSVSAKCSFRDEDMYVEGVRGRRSFEAPAKAFSHLWTIIRADLNFDQEVNNRTAHAQSAVGSAAHSRERGGWGMA